MTSPPSPAPAPTRRKLLLAAGGVLVGLGLLAALGRLGGGPSAAGEDALYGLFVPADQPDLYRDIYVRSDDPVLEVELRPGANGAVNADGFIGRRYARPKPAGTWRVVGLGDSVTMYFAAEGLGYLNLLEAALPKVVGRPVEILNFGVGGYDTAQEVRQLELKGLRFEPDYVIVAHVLNDSLSPVDAADALNARPEGAVPGDDGVPVLQAISRALAARPELDPQRFFAEHLVKLPQWPGTLASLDQLGALSREHGFGVLLLLLPVFTRLEPDYTVPVHQALARHGRALGFDVLDLAPALAHADPRRVLNYPEVDAIHPNPLGHQLIYHAVLDWLAERRPWQRPEAP